MVRGHDRDIPFYVEPAREASGPLVELAIGNGRVAIPMALATGKPVLGVDLSRSMLDRARARAAAARVQRVLQHADMRDLTLDEPAGFDLLSVPLADAPADLGRSAFADPGLRTRTAR